MAAAVIDAIVPAEKTMTEFPIRMVMRLAVLASFLVPSFEWAVFSSLKSAHARCD